jgi:hypothetical protein
VRVSCKQLRNELEGKQNGSPPRRGLRGKVLYESMNDEDKYALLDLLSYCTEIVGFGVFAILDGARFIEGLGKRVIFD